MGFLNECDDAHNQILVLVVLLKTLEETRNSSAAELLNVMTDLQVFHACKNVLNLQDVTHVLKTCKGI